MRRIAALSALSLLLLAAAPVHAQRSCATDSVHTHMMGLASYAQAFQAKINAVNQASQNKSIDCTSPLIIPVAVHFQSTGISEACAIEMALDQIQILNEDFAATNTDIAEWYTQQPTIWPNINNEESCIQFCLATSNHPSGFGLMEGDYAVTIDQTTGDYNSAWAGYLNMWIRDIGPLGYSPLGGSGNGDGVTCHPQAFSSISCGGNTLYGTYDLGRTITHEVGHYLLLNHPWASGGCSSNDNVADTPVTSEPIYGCPSGQSIVNCSDPVLWPSYMDYCDDACLFMFSAGQVARMESYVTSSLQNLLNNSVTACQDPCEGDCGCTDPAACNYDEAASNDDGTCDYSCQGCTDSAACNYDPNATQDNGSCTYPTEDLPCACSLDFPFDIQTAGTGVGISETFEATALAAVSSLSIEVEYSNSFNGSWAGDLLLGLCDPAGACIEIGGYNMIYGYTDAGAWPQNWMTESAGTYTATIDLSSYGLTGAGDWSIELTNGWTNASATASWVGTVTIDDLCPGVNGTDIEGCTNEAACNYDPSATIDNGSCTELDACGVCGGPGTDSDGDGIADCNEVPGCTDPASPLYNPEATDDDGTCECSVDIAIEAALTSLVYTDACTYEMGITWGVSPILHPDATVTASINGSAVALTNTTNGGVDLFTGTSGSISATGETMDVPVTLSVSCPNGATESLTQIVTVLPPDDADCTGCPEDINNNGTVEVTDVLLLLGSFGCTSECGAADIDGDGLVSVSDILLLLAAFGEEC